MVTLTEEELAEGIRLALRATHNLAEGAGAASLAAAVKLRSALAGKKVVCVMSGGNIDHPTLVRVIEVGRGQSPLVPDCRGSRILLNSTPFLWHSKVS